MVLFESRKISRAKADSNASGFRLQAASCPDTLAGVAPALPVPWSSSYAHLSRALIGRLGVDASEEARIAAS
jgi:hypothetical protein